MGVPRLLIAGTHSGVGKTTISTGIMAAFAARGLCVQGFKVGPDYIDPSYHTGATGRVSRNLDVWLMGDYLRPSFNRAIKGADLAVIEGVMGLFDGIKGRKGAGSCAHIASLIGAPVILIIDVRSLAYSAAALVHGFASFDPGVKIAGVILNRVGSQSHYEMVKEAVESIGIPVVGCLGKEERFTLPERHLGLVPLVEKGLGVSYFSELAAVIEQGIDLDRLLELAKAGSLQPSHEENCQRMVESGVTVKIAVAMDEAFSFYYQDALDTLTSCGAEIVPFSPLHDQELPPTTEGVFIGGGFPESFLAELAANESMRRSILEAGHRGIPIYAECGGLMYLCREIRDFQGRIYSGVGLVPAVSAMHSRLQGMGYRRGILQADTILGPKGTVVQGHEFHYSATDYAQISPAYSIQTANGEDKGLEGYAYQNILGSYLHLNFAGNPDLARNFLESCRIRWEEGTWASQ